MDDRFLGSMIADWLHESDVPLPDAADNVRIAVERAGQARQWGWVPRWRVATHTPGRFQGPSLRTAFASVAAAFVAVGLLVAVLLVGLGESTSTKPLAVSTEDGLHWQADHIDLRADAFRLELGDKTYTSVGAPMRADFERAEGGQPILWVEWTEHGHDMRLELVAMTGAASSLPRGRDDEWWVEEVRVRAPEDPDQWLHHYGPLFTTPLGEVFEDDVELVLAGDGHKAVLDFEGLVLGVTGVPEPEWWRGAHILGIPIPDFIGPLLPREWGPGADPTPRPTATPLTRVAVPYAGSELQGRIREDGTIRIDRDSGHNTKNLVDVAVGPDDAVWIAQPNRVYRLGVSGGVYTKRDGPPTIEWIEPRADGTVYVYSDGVWLLDGTEWTKLSDELVPKPHVDAPDLGAAIGADFIYEGTTSDGSVWARTAGERSRLLLIPAVDETLVRTGVLGTSGTVSPASVEAAGLELVGEDLGEGVIRITDDGSDFDLSALAAVTVAADGSVWVADRHRIHRLGDDSPATPQSGIGRIEGLWPESDGSLRISGDDRWLLEDGRWRDLPEPIRGAVDHEGKPGRTSVAGILSDGTVVGVRHDADGNAAPFILEDEAWVRQPAYKQDARYFTGDSLWAVSWNDGEFGSDWAQFVDGRWAPIEGDMMSLVRDPGARILTSAPLHGDTLWFFLGTNNEHPQRIVRYLDGTWSTFGIEGIERVAGSSVDLRSVWSVDGRWWSLASTSRWGQVRVLLDGEIIVVLPRMPLDFWTQGVSDDGSVWGLGDDGSLLVMPNAATFTELEEIESRPPEG